MIDELSGLWSVRPWLSFSMGVIMLSLLGFPIFGGAGFFAKWYVLQAALQAPYKQTFLAVVLVLTTVVSAGYYLYVVMVMFMRPRADDAPVPERAGGMTQVVLAVSVVLILVIGVVPESVVSQARAARPRMAVEPETTQLPVRSSTARPDSLRFVAATQAAGAGR
jgi:NADH-quinone oxidoreductase subunit N